MATPDDKNAANVEFSLWLTCTKATVSMLNCIRSLVSLLESSSSSEIEEDDYEDYSDEELSSDKM